MSFKVYYVDDEHALLDMFVDMFSSPGRVIVTFSDPLKAVGANAQGEE